MLAPDTAKPAGFNFWRFHYMPLGPKPLFHFLDEVERGADLRSHLERYAALPADFIKAHAGDRFAPSLHCIDWGEP